MGYRIDWTTNPYAPEIIETQYQGGDLLRLTIDLAAWHMAVALKHTLEARKLLADVSL